MTQWTYSNAEQTVAHRTFGGAARESRLVSAIELADGEEIAPFVPDLQEMALRARGQRNQLLTESDWTQAADVPQALKDVWAPYRQALRDVPQQAGFPTDIVWPTKP
jgi:hypothetical protein